MQVFVTPFFGGLGIESFKIALQNIRVKNSHFFSKDGSGSHDIENLDDVEKIGDTRHTKNESPQLENARIGKFATDDPRKEENQRDNKDAVAEGTGGVVKLRPRVIVFFRLRVLEDKS